MKRSNITRKDLARAINEKMGFSQRGSAQLVDEVFSCVKEALLSEEPVKLVQFGSFQVMKKGVRMGRNPRTGTAMEIAPRSMISFRASKVLRAKVNE
ncbi:MAG: integration host factor subunit alpha [Thermodesulfobacteriota bacterium]